MKTIDNWKQEVFDYNTSLNEKLKQNEQAKSLYYGFDLFDGKIIENPDILFMGINPGKGEGEDHYDVRTHDEDMSYLDVFDKNYRTPDYYKNGYPLAEFAVEIIKNLGVEKHEIPNYLSEKCVKTNLYHITTKGSGEIKPALKTIGGYDDYYNKSNYFLDSLIKVIKPKVIVFEGASAYNPFVEDCCEAKNTWNGAIGAFEIKSLNLVCIGYKRNNQRGAATDAKSVADKIKSYNIL